MKVRAVPKGVPLQVRNVLTCLVDITSMPTVPLIDLLLAKVIEPEERQKLEEIKRVLVQSGWAGLAAAGRDHRAAATTCSHLLDEFPLVLDQHLRVPAGGSAAAAALLLDEFEPAHSRHGTAHIAVGSHASTGAGDAGPRFRG